MANLSDILSEPHLVAFISLSVAICVEKLMPWPDKYHPLSLWKLIALRMAQKVLPSAQHSPKQHQISGALACIVMLLPICILMSIFVFLAEYPFFFETLFLVIALRHSPVDTITKHLTPNIKQNKKYLARDLISQILLRETDKLSNLGLCKAACETLVLRFNYQFCAVVFWFLLTGGVGALLYRVIYESAQIWNIKHQEYKNFGLFSRTLTTYLQWPASILGGISVGIASLTWSGLSAFANNLWLNPRGFMLHIAGASLGIQLGGPAFYQGVKRKSDKYGGPRELVLDDLQRCRNLLKLSRLLWVCICLIGYIVLYLLGT